jgi:nicotinamidase-related amidase
MFPWDDVIPEGDLAAFRRSPEPVDAPPRAGSRPALVIVDMTRMFVDQRYPSGCALSGPAVEANQALLDKARNQGIPVFFTKAYADPLHQPSQAEQGLWKHGLLTPPGLPPGDVVIDELSPLPGETVITKGSKPSAFFGTSLMAMLVALRIDTVIVAGISTSGCVRATALDAFQYNLHVLIPHEATADRSQVSHKVNLFDLHMKYASVRSTESVLAYIGRVGPQDRGQGGYP